MAGKFQIKSRKWDVGTLIGSVVLLALGIGGLFLLQSSGNSAGSSTNIFVILLGVVTFLLFAGPGLVYVLRKRVKAIKNALPGGTMTWIRSHLYLPVLALLAAYVHAQAVPFRATLTSGKTLLVLGILVSVAGMARHHLIGIQKAALNVNVAVGKLTTGQPRPFRRIVADYTDHKLTRAEVEAAMAQFEPPLQEKWRRIAEISDEVEQHFPREGGQRWHIRQYKLWKALHPPLTIALFLVLAFHVWDVLGGTRAVAGEEEKFAASSECAECHSATFEEWAGSTMAHASTSTINEGQLPVTLAVNGQIIEAFADFEDEGTLGPTELLVGRDLDGDGTVDGQDVPGASDEDQGDFVEARAQVCIDCHMPVGGSFTDDPFAVLPFGEGDSPVNGNDAVVEDGVGCIVCHTIETPPAEIQGAAALVGDAVQAGSGGTYGTMYGPIFTDPNPVPVRIHGIETPGEDGEGFWRNDLETSQLCGACHNVKLDIDGDGLAENEDAEEAGIVDIIDDAEAVLDGDIAATDIDEDADFILDENDIDDDRVQTPGGVAVDDDGGDGLIDDLVLQTTYDEWQDYVAFFEAEVNDSGFGGFTERYADAGETEVDGDDVPLTNELDTPLGCNSCHMPFSAEGTEGPVVDYAAGLLPIPDRLRREHTFVGVDYDLDPGLYKKSGLSNEDIAAIVAERDALIQSAATVDVALLDAVGDQLPVTVEVRNNLLAHSFPTGFAFARQFWLEVSAEANGEQICLANPVEGVFAQVPCGSGFSVGDEEPIAGGAELPQCDSQQLVQATPPGTLSIFGAEFVVPDTDIDFAGGPRFVVDDTGAVVEDPEGAQDAFSAAFGPEECDPWLANFQKILTDGDPENDGLREEVPYQPLLPDAVKTRAQVASGLEMQELQPVRLRNDEPADSVLIPYVFQLNGADPASVEVTVRMRFRHLPPYFVRDLDERQDDIDNVPDGAQLDAEELLGHMTVGEVVTAVSGEGPQLGCAGPQNGAETIRTCIDDADIDQALEDLNLGDGGGGGDDDEFEREDGAGVTPTGGELAMWGPLGMALLVPVAGLRRRSRAR